ncbi:hypothetical protein KKC_09707 [Listeria fleischmannii subsp. coloradonensis]|nr:hypothetical protein KKC_09707 [Listeria fleischmannii subsp. coloradonensis]
METVQSLRERIAVSDHRAKADCIIQNGRIINVFTRPAPIISGPKTVILPELDRFMKQMKSLMLKVPILPQALLMPMSMWKVP